MQSQAHRIIVKKEQHERAKRQHVQSDEPELKPFDRVWVKLFDKHSQSPKLDPTLKPGIIIEQKSSSTFKVNRLNRSRRKNITLNKTLVKVRNSEHPMDTNIIPKRSSVRKGGSLGKQNQTAKTHDQSDQSDS